MALTDKVSYVFAYTDEAHEQYVRWRQAYHNLMYTKYGDKALNVHENRFVMLVDGVQMIQVVLQLELVEDNNGTVSSPEEGGRGT